VQGIVLHTLGNNRLAEKVVRDAVNYDPTYSQAWLVALLSSVVRFAELLPRRKALGAYCCVFIFRSKVGKKVGRVILVTVIAVFMQGI
jgi:hypothetical protein